MKKLLITLLTITTLISSCKKEDIQPKKSIDCKCGVVIKKWMLTTSGPYDFYYYSTKNLCSGNEIKSEFKSQMNTPVEWYVVNVGDTICNSNTW